MIKVETNRVLDRSVTVLVNCPECSETIFSKAFLNETTGNMVTCDECETQFIVKALNTVQRNYT